MRIAEAAFAVLGAFATATAIAGPSTDGNWHGQLHCSALLPGVTGPAASAGPFSTPVTVTVASASIRGLLDSAVSEQKISGTFDGFNMRVLFDGKRKDRPAWWQIDLHGKARDGVAELDGNMTGFNPTNRIRTCKLTLSSAEFEKARGEAAAAELLRADQARRAAETAPTDKTATEKVNEGADASQRTAGRQDIALPVVADRAADASATAATRPGKALSAERSVVGIAPAHRAISEKTVTTGTPAHKTGSASFDCATASSRIENAVCASSQLSRLDSDLAAAYQAVLARSVEPMAVKAAQRAWLKETRNACQDEACMVTVYQQRIAALGGSAPKGETESENNKPPSTSGSATGAPSNQPGPNRLFFCGLNDLSAARKRICMSEELSDLYERLENNMASASNRLSGVLGGNEQAAMLRSKVDGFERNPDASCPTADDGCLRDAFRQQIESANQAVERFLADAASANSAPAAVKAKAEADAKLAATLEEKKVPVEAAADAVKAQQNDPQPAKGQYALIVALVVALLAWIAVASIAWKRGWSKVVGVGGGGVLAASLFAGIATSSVPTAKLEALDASKPPSSSLSVSAAKTDAINVSQQPIPLISMLTQMRFGSPSKALPAGFIQTADTISTDELMTKLLGTVQTCKIYKNPPRASASDDHDVQMVSACFDIQDRLNQVAVVWNRDLQLFDRFESMIARALGPTASRNRINDSGLEWSQQVRGVDVSVRLTLVPDTLMFIQSLEFDPATAAAQRRRALESDEAKKKQYAKDLELARSSSFAFSDAADELRNAKGRLSRSCPQEQVDGLQMYIRSIENKQKVWGDDPVSVYYSNKLASGFLAGLRQLGCLAGSSGPAEQESGREAQRSSAHRYTALVTCSSGGTNVTVLGCFEDTELRISRANRTQAFNITNLSQAGQFDGVTLKIALGESFSLRAQNSHVVLALGVKISDETGKVVFEDQRATRGGVIAVKSD